MTGRTVVVLVLVLGQLSLTVGQMTSAQVSCFSVNFARFSDTVVCEMFVVVWISVFLQIV